MKCILFKYQIITSKFEWQEVPSRSDMKEWSDAMLLGGEYMREWLPSTDLSRALNSVARGDPSRRIHFALTGDTWGLLYSHDKQSLFKVCRYLIYIINHFQKLLVTQPFGKLLYSIFLISEVRTFERG